MHTGKAGNELVQEIWLKAMVKVDYPGLGGEIRAAYRGVVITIGVIVVMLFLSVPPEYTGHIPNVMVDPDVFLPPVVGQTWRGNITHRAVIRQGDKPVQHRRGIGIDGHFISRKRQAGCRVDGHPAAGGNYRVITRRS